MLIALQFSAFPQKDVSLPLSSLLINSAYGWRIHPVSGKMKFHYGLDLRASRDTVFSILPGVIRVVGNDPNIGNMVVVDHGSGIETLYGHLSAIAVLPGDVVEAGSTLGITGSSGRVTGEHLHFAVKYRGRTIPPLKFLTGLFRPP